MSFKITPLNEEYPSLQYLTQGQKASYDFIKSNFDKGCFVNLEENISYVTLYASSKLDEILTKGKSLIDAVIKNFIILEKLYPDKSLGIGHTISDLFYIKGDRVMALKKSEEVLQIGVTATHQANHILNLKYQLNVDVSARELLSINKRFTKFAVNKMPEIESYANFILKKEKDLRGHDYLKDIGDKYNNKEHRHYPVSLFWGYTNGYQLTKMLNPELQIDGYCFYAIPELYDFCSNLCRDAENMLRDEMDIPKVGEGWVAETELFYQIKKYLPGFDIVHHFTDKWLGRQHLDIFIPKLKIAFEYQGEQHFKPVDFFGGEASFKETQKRDRVKKAKCTKHKITLYQVLNTYTIEEIKVIIQKHIV